MNSLQILSFVGFTLLVAVITQWKVRKTDTGSQQGYFLAGRSLKAPVIAASLMLTNLSTEQLVGLSGQAYKSGMSVMGWEVTSAVTLIFLALIFLPRYLKRGIATIPDFLRNVMINDAYYHRLLLPHCHRRLLSADCSLFRRVGAQQPVSCG